MKKRCFYLIIFISLFIFSAVRAQQDAIFDHDAVKIEREKQLILQNDGKVHLYVKRNEDGKSEEFEKEYQNFEDAKKDGEFNTNDIDQIETLSADLSYAKKNCQYRSIKIIESSVFPPVEKDEINDESLSNPNYLAYSETGSREFKVWMPENMPDAFDKFIRNDLEVKLLDYFPNPANGDLTFNIGLLHKKPLEVSLINKNGDEIYYKAYPKSSENIIDDIDLTKFSSGVYLLKFKQKNKALTRKLLIE